MKIGFLKEVKDTRVAISPLVVLKYEKIGIEIVVEKGAGQSSGIDDNDFQKNATIFSKEKVIMEEGCLSLPKQFANIERPQSITVSYLNESNKVLEEKKEGLEARILQHEIDHLYGKLFVDYLSSLKRNILIKKVNKLKKMGEI